MHIRPDLIKLDRSLIEGIDVDETRAALVESFVHFAGQIGAGLCAEGVETREELRALFELRVMTAQGYLLARPSAPWAAVSADVVTARAEALVRSSTDACSTVEPSRGSGLAAAGRRRRGVRIGEAQPADDQAAPDLEGRLHDPADAAAAVAARAVGEDDRREEHAVMLGDLVTRPPHGRLALKPRTSRRELRRTSGELFETTAGTAKRALAASTSPRRRSSAHPRTTASALLVARALDFAVAVAVAAAVERPVRGSSASPHAASDMAATRQHAATRPAEGPRLTADEPNRPDPASPRRMPWVIAANRDDHTCIGAYGARRPRRAAAEQVARRPPSRSMVESHVRSPRAGTWTLP
jgi:hypothetical protein